MSTQEIIAQISHLSREDLCAIAVQVDRTLRERGAIIYDDAYGLFTEADQASLASEAWNILDHRHGKASPE